MGTWGTGFWSDDLTSDVRYDYLDLLRKQVSPADAVAKLLETHEPDKDDEAGYLFWLAVASLQWDYGHLSDDVKDKALRVFDTTLDEERWAEANARDRKKRKEVMAALRQKLSSENPSPKKLRPYVKKRNPWKVGDVISLRFEHMQRDYVPPYMHPFQGMYGAVLIVDFCELDIGDVYMNPVVAIYDWIGKEPATMADLEKTPFLKTEMYYNFEHGKWHFWTVDMPCKRLYDWYGLERIGHLDELPISPKLLQEAYDERSETWGTIEMAIVDERVKGYAVSRYEEERMLQKRQENGAGAVPPLLDK